MTSPLTTLALASALSALAARKALATSRRVANMMAVSPSYDAT